MAIHLDDISNVDNTAGRSASVSLSHKIVFVDGKEIECEPVEFIPNKESGWALYMKRKNKFYFKSPFGKRSIELNPAPKELIEMKYGTECEVSWE